MLAEIAVCLPLSRTFVYELAEAFGDPGQRDVFLATPALEFLDPSVGEVHVS